MVLLEIYHKEGVVVTPYTIEDYQKEAKEEALKSLTEEDIDLLLKVLKPEALLKRLKRADIEKYLKKTQKEGSS